MVTMPVTAISMIEVEIEPIVPIIITMGFNV